MNKNINYMKTIIRSIACLGILVAAASCQMYEIDTQMTPEKIAASIRMECDALPAYTVPAVNPGTVNFKVSANTPWSITRSSDADWCTVTPSSSSNGALISDVVVSFDTNNELTDRTATLTLRGEKVGQVVSIKITQGRKGRLFVTPVSQDYVAGGGPLNFTIQTNQAWEIRSSEEWLSFNRESGEPDPDGRTITIIATAAPSTVMERMATVTITAGEEEETFEVAQRGKFELAEIASAFKAAGGTQVLKLRTDLPWEVDADKDWISFDRTEGTGDGKYTDITVTAAANDAFVRTANITVKAGDASKSFEVTQQGVSFEIVPPADATIAAAGGDLTVEVNCSIAWEVVAEDPAVTVAKVDDSHFKVTAPFNNIFKEKAVKVSIKGAGGALDSITLTQGCAFTIEDADVLEDGSVKIYGDKKSRVTLTDPCRYVSFVLLMGEVSFDDKAQFCLSTHDAAGDSELQCQINMAGNKRLRTNGGHTTYGSSKFDLTVDELNAIKEYKMEFRPNAENPANIDLEFFYNGTSKKVHTSTSPYTDPAASGHYFFGTESAAEGSATWYIVKSCTPTFIAE